jgi:hypothetical protein
MSDNIMFAYILFSGAGELDKGIPGPKVALVFVLCCLAHAHISHIRYGGDGVSQRGAYTWH